jgi:sorbitol/mannitol transport system substrate-binding protein
LTIATVNNPDVILMQPLSRHFEAQNPHLRLEWVVLEENVLRQRVTADIAASGGQFDVLTMGTYEVPLWAERGWLIPMEALPDSYALDDVLKPVRDALSYQGRLYALPLYAESSMTFYRTDLFEKAGIAMPEQPDYEQIARFAAARVTVPMTRCDR